MNQWSAVIEHRDVLLQGFAVTCISSFWCLVLSMALGLLVVVAGASPLRLLRVASNIYVEVFQNTPYLLVVLFFYDGLAQAGLKFTPLQAGVIGLSMYSGAYMAEAIRSGILAVDRGQWLAARASGFGFLHTIVLIVMPQALAYAIPPLTNQWVRLVKNTSVLAIIAGGDLLYQTNQLVSETYIVFPFYLVVAAAYLVLTIPLTRAAELVERSFGWRRVAMAREAVT